MKRTKKTKTTKVVKVKRATKPTKTSHVTVLLDRSGSMVSIKDDVIGGFNSFLAEQRKNGKNTKMTFVQFDSVNPFEVVASAKAPKDVAELTQDTFVPRGGTPLFDAIGKTVAHMDLQMRHAKQYPDRVVLAIVTDGQENASIEFRRVQVEELIKQKTKLDWQVVFLSSDLKAVSDAQSYGIKASNTLAYGGGGGGASVRCAFMSLASNTTNYISGTEKSMAFTDKDRAQQPAEKLVDKK